MERSWDLNQVSDGRLYCDGDRARVGCHDCNGCSACCRGMGTSITLDPYDIYNLTKGLKCLFTDLLKESVELSVVDGIILPNLVMEKSKESCYFLDLQGRCKIHEFRPGMCRLFPLGRIYENNDYKYFIQIHECVKADKTKVKISRWLGMRDSKKYHHFINVWHYFLKDIQKIILELNDDQEIKSMNIKILNTFFVEAYDTGEDFYQQFDKRVYEFNKDL